MRGEICNYPVKPNHLRLFSFSLVLSGTCVHRYFLALGSTLYRFFHSDFSFLFHAQYVYLWMSYL